MSEISINKFKEIVTLWVETSHFDYELGALTEDADEVAEQYEFDSWLNNIINERTEDNETDNTTIMELTSAIAYAEKIAYNLSSKAEERLVQTIASLITENETSRFFGKSIENINSEDISKIINSVYEEFEKVYKYETELQYKNFIEYFVSEYDQYKKQENK